MNTTAPMTSPASTTSQDVDLDAGTQTVDINAIGATGQRAPIRKLVFIAVATLIILTALALLGQHYFNQFVASWKQASPEPSAPPPSEQAAARVRLPDALTPLSPPGVPPLEAPTAPTPIIPAPTPVVTPTSGVPALVPTTSAPPEIDPKSRYRGDTTLAPPATNSSPSLAGMPMVNPGSFPPPPVSAAQLESRLKGLLTPTAAPSPTLANNPILSGNNNSGPANPQGNVGAMLNSASTPKAVAIKAFDPSLTIPKGDAIDCTMTTRVVTEISGFTSCVVSSPVYSADGRVLLIERMSEVQGEYAAVGQPGQRRVFVLWTRIRKPGGITIDIASPSTDPLGAAGMDGIVDNRWFERIGSAYMLSIFQDFLAASSAKAAGGTAGINSSAASSLYQNSLNTSKSLAEQVLQQSINIKPTVYAHQGQRVSIYVARDLDFASVYEVKPTTTGGRK